MGKKTEQERAKRAEQEATLSRRRFLLRSGAAALAAIGTGSYFATREDPPLDPETADAVRIYKDLKTTVEAKYKEAKREGKPFRVFVLEGHGDINAVAYELMLIDICKNLGMNKLLEEIANDDVPDLANPKTKGKVRLPDPKAEECLRMTLEGAAKKGVKIIGMDNSYPTADSTTKARLNYASKFMHEEISRLYPVTDLSISLSTDKEDQRLETLHFQINHGRFMRPIDISEHGADRAIFNQALDTAKSKTLDIMRDERNASMLKEIDKHPSSIVITGKNHAVDLVAKTRQAGGMDVTYSVTNSQAKKEYLANPTVTPERRAALEWADDPKNAIQTEEKMFNAENLPAFIEKVSQIANQAQRSR